MARISGYAAAVAMVLVCVRATADEIQLAGMRLGQHAINLLDVWDQPDGIVVGEGTEQITAAQAPGAAAGVPLMTQPGAMPGMAPPMMGPQGMGPPMMGPRMGPQGIGPQGKGGPMMEPGTGPQAVAAAGHENSGAASGTDSAAGTIALPLWALPAWVAVTQPQPAPGAAAGAVPFPIWALPVWITLQPGEVEWIYQRGPVVMGFAIDRDGYITCIAVAGRECNWARTALWQPHRYVKLGDSFKRVLYRYGYPDRIETYTAAGPMTGDNSISVTFGIVNRVFSRDCILRYDEESNIAFTLHDFKVVRIHIWQR
ncbi:MAG: hypothetical protein N2512_03760 [Armatimonadetes bacterium]|nr:hypothetical protein [Armatimonadota bacterium]